MEYIDKLLEFFPTRQLLSLRNNFGFRCFYKMSNIYIQEPPTSGKVLLRTTVGDIDIELWARECPKACRNFVQLCLEGYYNGTTFHRVVKGFIAQGGDPVGDGSGGESIYGHPFKDEFHSRLRYSRRGLVGMANSGKDDNTSQFFFTFAATPELQNKNTLFGKVTGATIFNMLKLEEGIVDHQERPMYEHRIISTEILSNPFHDIVQRSLPKTSTKVKKIKNVKQGIKNFGLLSFGKEAEDDEEETAIFVKQIAGRAKSLHDAADDPYLSKEPIKVPKLENAVKNEAMSDDCETISKTTTNSDKVRSKLTKSWKPKSTKPVNRKEIKIESEEDDEDNDILITQVQEQKRKISEEKTKIREEIILLKRQYQMDKVANDKQISKDPDVKKLVMATANENHYIKDFIKAKEKYSVKRKNSLKGAGREEFTLALLSKFKSKLDSLKSNSEDTEKKPRDNGDNDVERDITGDDWLAHSLNFNSNLPVLAKDASTKSDDWYDAYDPRNPLNKRKRGEKDKIKHSQNSKLSS